jgi:hypothetical protein
MKIFLPLLLSANAQRNRIVTESTFQVIPEGFEGTFEGFNTTEILTQNSDDEIFQEFENIYAYMESPLGRAEYSEQQKQHIRKFKLLKNMIVYLQQIPLFGKFCFYGCYCFAKGPFKLLEQAGSASPMDPADAVCKKHAKCHYCAQMDFGADKCDITRPYKFAARIDAVTGEKMIECLNPEGSCKRGVCECDKQLAYDLRDQERSWNILHHQRWGQFSQDNCLAGGSEKQARGERGTAVEECCGNFPERFPYFSDDGWGTIRRCCGNKTYSPVQHMCCDGNIVEHGSC